MTLSDKVYDILKNAASLWLPALATFYFTLSQIWNLPAGAEVVGTIAALTTFLGAILKISTMSYNQGDAGVIGSIYSKGVNPDTGLPNLTMDLSNTHPDEILNASRVSLKVGEPDHD